MTKKRRLKRQQVFHFWFTCSLAVLSIGIIVLVPSASLLIVLAFLLAYVAGNGLIHARAQTLTRDILIEYGLVAVVALVVLIGAVGTWQ